MRIPSAVVALLAAACSLEPPAPPPPTDAEAQLEEHSQRFRQRVEQVTDRVFTAIGYSLANSVLIRGDGGNIIVDTTESRSAARAIKAEFETIADQPTAAIIFTHSHPDHIMGAIELREPGTRVIAHERFEAALDEQFSALQPILLQRGMRQFGTYLKPGEAINGGIGPFLEWSQSPPRFVRPTEWFRGERQALTIAGVELVLLHAPGETEDQLMVWLPGSRTLLCGDDWYPAFPNLYTIRGTSPRPVAAWFKSLDRARALRPEHLVPAHGEPVHGAQAIQEKLTAYRDGIQYVHDAVLRGANEGKSPDELAAEIRLPPHLARVPELTEYYGKVSWSVRSLYDRYLGWFDGNATSLEPLAPADRARRLVGLLGGPAAVLDRVRDALQAGEHQWAAELADLVLVLQPGQARARGYKAEALEALGRATVNANARHYYLTQARELRGEVHLPQRLPIDAELARSIPLDKIFQAMPARLDPEASRDVHLTVLFRITDTEELYTVEIRRGVAEVRQGVLPPEPDLTLIVAGEDWKQIALGITSPALSLVTGRLRVEGSLLDLARFGKLFKPLE